MAESFFGEDGDLMPGRPRESLDALLAKGNSHLTKAEIAERRESEIRNPNPPKRLVPPKWLPDEQKSEFKRVSGELIALMPSMVCKLDADILARYCILSAEWIEASDHLNCALSEHNAKEADRWSSIQNRLFNAAQKCAADCGLTISARCRIVVPEAPTSSSDNPILKLLENRNA